MKILLTGEKHIPLKDQVMQIVYKWWFGLTMEDGKECCCIVPNKNYGADADNKRKWFCVLFSIIETKYIGLLCLPRHQIFIVTCCWILHTHNNENKRLYEDEMLEISIIAMVSTQLFPRVNDLTNWQTDWQTNKQKQRNK